MHFWCAKGKKAEDFPSQFCRGKHIFKNPPRYFEDCLGNEVPGPKNGTQQSLEFSWSEYGWQIPLVKRLAFKGITPCHLFRRNRIGSFMLDKFLELHVIEKMGFGGFRSWFKFDRSVIGRAKSGKLSVTMECFGSGIFGWITPRWIVLLQPIFLF